jgi:hypothetical protein
MEKPLESLSTKSTIRIPVTPKLLREAADRLEHELKNNTLDNQEAELPFSRSVTFYSEKEPERQAYTTITSDDPGKKILPLRSENPRAVLN